MHRTFAAVDLGSNSFHLLVARDEDGRLSIIDKLKERVRLASGLDERRELSEAAAGRALECLELFGHRLVHLRPDHVRAVGTNTLRKMADPTTFLARAEAALGHRIEIISGIEEARLVYRGVAHDLADDGERRLVVDIGGGSTEVIVGEGREILRADSLYMGCVEFTERYFGDGRFSPEQFERAVVAARLELGSVHRPVKRLGWSRVLGSSGTINAVQTVLTLNGRADHCITDAGLDWLMEQHVAARKLRKLALEGLKDERAQVFAGGVAILKALFRSLRIERMVASSAALREGLIHELVGRDAQHDVRDETVERMRDRFGADPIHAERVAELALRLFDQAAAGWSLDRDEGRRLLRWAGTLHEIGKAISYAGYHRHGAYLVAHGDMPGFSKGEQAIVAALLQGQRRKLVPERVRELAGRRTDDVLRLIVLLRLATRLSRTRSPNPRPPIALSVQGPAVELHFPTGWLDERPLTKADLEMEAGRMGQAGFTLSWG